jgi:hypothetical protein
MKTITTSTQSTSNNIFPTQQFRHPPTQLPHLQPFKLEFSKMQYTTLATTLLGSALLTSAAPTLVPRACQTAYPSSIGFPINYDIHQDANGANPRVDALTFSNIPAGSYGCQLEVDFPAGYPIASSGASAINIFALNEGTVSLFGTVTLQSSADRATKVVINSAACKRTMGYEIRIASGTEAGRVAFADTLDAGFTMKYDC